VGVGVGVEMQLGAAGDVKSLTSVAAGAAAGAVPADVPLPPPEEEVAAVLAVALTATAAACTWHASAARDLGGGRAGGGGGACANTYNSASAGSCSNHGSHLLHKSSSGLWLALLAETPHAHTALFPALTPGEALLLPVAAPAAASPPATSEGSDSTGRRPAAELPGPATWTHQQQASRTPAEPQQLKAWMARKPSHMSCSTVGSMVLPDGVAMKCCRRGYRTLNCLEANNTGTWREGTGGPGGGGAGDVQLPTSVASLPAAAGGPTTSKAPPAAAEGLAVAGSAKQAAPPVAAAPHDAVGVLRPPSAEPAWPAWSACPLVREIAGAAGSSCTHPHISESANSCGQVLLILAAQKQSWLLEGTAGAHPTCTHPPLHSP
jgi:hypothetical protein